MNYSTCHVPPRAKVKGLTAQQQNMTHSIANQYKNQSQKSIISLFIIMSAFTQEEIEAQIAAAKVAEKYGDASSHSDLEEEEDEDKNFDEWVEDDDAEPVKSLFSAKSLPSIQALIEHDKEIHGFDLQQVVGQYCTDDISFIKLINFIRSTVVAMSSADVPSIIAKVEEGLTQRLVLEEDVYMRPVLSDDPLLYLYEDFFANIAVADEDETAAMPVIKSIEELSQINNH